MSANYKPDFVLGYGMRVNEKAGGGSKEGGVELQAEGPTWAE